MDGLTRKNISVEPLYNGSCGNDFIGMEQMHDGMLDIILNGPTINGITKSMLRGMVRQLYGALQTEENRAEPENPQPLTLEQLKERDGKPVYVVHRNTKAWFLVNGDNLVDQHGNLSDMFISGFYFSGVKFYDHQPKELTP